MLRDSVVKYMNDRPLTGTAYLITNHKPTNHPTTRPERQRSLAKKQEQTHAQVIAKQVKSDKRKLAGVQPLHVMGMVARTYDEAESLRVLIARFRGEKDVVYVDVLGVRTPINREHAANLDNSDTVDKTR